MGAVVFGSGIVIGLSLVGAGYTSAGLLSTVAVALVSLANYLYVPMPAFAEEKGQRQKILAKLRLGNFWAWLQTLMGRGHIMQITRRNFDQTTTPDPEVMTEDTKLDDINVRIYQPADLSDDEELPGVIHFHGGGFCWESFRLHDTLIKTMLKLKRMVVVHVRYRLAPEFPFPAAVDDCFKVTRYVQMNTKQFRMDPQRLVLMGDSAGGNLTMNMLIRMITEAVPSLPKFKLQIAIYPYIQALDFKTPSYQIYDSPKAPTLQDADLMIKFLITYALGFTAYDESEIRNLLENKHWTAELRNSSLPKLVNDDVLPENLERPKLKTAMSKSVDSSLARKFNDIFLDPRFSPLFAAEEILRKIPKTYILSTELDCLRDDAFFLADRLRNLDVDVTHRHWEGMDHAFLVFSDYKNTFKALKEITNFMNDNL